MNILIIIIISLSYLNRIQCFFKFCIGLTLLILLLFVSKRRPSLQTFNGDDDHDGDDDGGDDDDDFDDDIDD